MIATVGRFASIALLVALAQSAAAQAPPDFASMDQSTFDKFLADAHIHEITVDAAYHVEVIFSRTKDARPAQHRISCDGGMLAVQDLYLKHDDRWATTPGACDALLAAARRRKEAQGG